MDIGLGSSISIHQLVPFLVYRLDDELLGSHRKRKRTVAVLHQDTGTAFNMYCGTCQSLPCDNFAVDDASAGLDEALLRLRHGTARDGNQQC